jgi:hypothetical protein
MAEEARVAARSSREARAVTEDREDGVAASVVAQVDRALLREALRYREHTMRWHRSLLYQS